MQSKISGYERMDGTAKSHRLSEYDCGVKMTR